MLTFAALTSLGLVALLFAEHAESRRGIWIAKPLTSTGFIATAIAAGALDSTYGRWVVVALGLSWLGDVLLIPTESQTSFRAGILAFLLGHVAYAAGFATLQPTLGPSLGALAVAAPLAIAVVYWLGHRGQVPAELAMAVHAYITVISVMVILAVGAAASAGCVWIGVGAVFFFVSDLAVARDRFVAPGIGNRTWGLPLYYGGQLVLAITPSLIASP